MKYRTIHLLMEDTSDFETIEQRARELVGGEDSNASLIAWWDVKARDGGPREGCAGDSYECVARYATGHGGRYKVMVNGGLLELFYTVPDGDWQELDPEAVRRTHREATTGIVDNIQGG